MSPNPRLWAEAENWVQGMRRREAGMGWGALRGTFCHQMGGSVRRALFLRPLPPPNFLSGCNRNEHTQENPQVQVQLLPVDQPLQWIQWGVFATSRQQLFLLQKPLSEHTACHPALPPSPPSLEERTPAELRETLHSSSSWC